MLDLEDNITILETSISDMQDTIGDLDFRVTTLEFYVATMNATVTDLESRIGTLESQILSMNNTIWNATRSPDFDTGWENFTRGQERSFQHWLNSTDLLVYMMGRIPGASPYIHSMFFGSVHDYGWKGCFWHDLSSAEISVTRNPSDDYWEQVRIMIWKIPQP